MSAALLVFSVAVSLGAAAVVRRVKNSSMTNYDIEMWRYAKELKIRSGDPHLDFDHVKSKSSVLQGVTLRLNEWGLRGGPVESLPPDARRILFLGGRITLGRGVAVEVAVQPRVERMMCATGG